MKRNNFRLRPVAVMMLLSLPVIVLFQNCATKNFTSDVASEEATTGSSSPDSHGDVNALTQDASQDRLQYARPSASERFENNAETEATVSPEKAQSYLGAKTNLISEDGQLVPQDWDQRVSQMTDLEQNMNADSKQEVVSIGRDVLIQLVQEIHEGEELTPQQMRALERSLSLLSYGIRDQQDRNEMTSYFVGQTRNSHLASTLSNLFETLR